MKDHDWWWHLPHKGIHREHIDAKLAHALTPEKCINYREDPILGFPGTIPADIALEVHGQFAKRQPNNLGYHTKCIPSEKGFKGTQELEEWYIYAVAEMLGVENPQKEIDGYICSGGTEGNYHGLWLARNMLWKKRPIKPSERRGVVVLHSFLSHYSVGKAFSRLLESDPETNPEDGRGIIVELPTDHRGELAPHIVERYVRRYYEQGYRRFAVFLTAGTINLGSIDPVGAVNNALEVLADTLDIAVAIHVDAAFGGFVIPFLEPEFSFAFQHSLVASVSLDAHKTGLAPYSAGTFLCRKGLLKYTATDAPYIYGHEDNTVSGSRSGAMAAACWATLMHYGRAGYEKIAREGVRMRKYLEERFHKIKGVVVYPSRMNLLAVHLREPLDERILMGYCIVPDQFPAPLYSPEREGVLIKRKRTVYRFTLMPHVTEEKIDRFFKELKR